MQQQPPQGFYGQPTIYGGYPLVPPPLPLRKPTMWQRFRSARKWTQWGIGCATLLLILSLYVCSTTALGAAVGPQKTTILNPTATTMPQSTQVAQIVATSLRQRSLLHLPRFPHRCQSQRLSQHKYQPPHRHQQEPMETPGGIPLLLAT